MFKFSLCFLLLSWSALALADTYTPTTTARPRPTGREEIAFNGNSYYGSNTNWQSNVYVSDQDYRPQVNPAPTANSYYLHEDQFNPRTGYEGNSSYVHRNWDYGTNWRFNSDAYLRGEDQSQYDGNLYQEQRDNYYRSARPYSPTRTYYNNSRNYVQPAPSPYYYR